MRDAGIQIAVNSATVDIESELRKAHKEAGVPLAIWRNGAVIWLQPEQIEVGEGAASTSPDENITPTVPAFSDEKFRAWDAEMKLWVPAEVLAMTAFGDILTYEEGEDRWCEESIPLQISWATVFSDCNGAPIFEGDILLQGGGRTPLLVVREGGKFILRGTYDADLGFYAESCTVIGNVFENPELAP